MSGKAKQNRDELVLQFMGVRSSLQQVCETSPVMKRAVTRKVADLEQIWEKLIRSHSLYCKVAAVGIESSESNEFIDQKARLKEEALQLADNALGENVEEDSAVVGKRLQRSVELLAAEVEFAMPALSGFSTDQLNYESHQEALRLVQENMDKMRRYMEMCNQAELKLEITAAETLNKTITDTYKEQGAKLYEIRRQIMKNAPTMTAAPEPKYRMNQGGQGGGDDTSGGGVKKQPMKIKPLDCPTWDGKFRSFARFKLLWHENITPRHEDSALHLMLCQALPKYILDNISTLTSSADEIWEHLEDKFGKPEVVAKEVMGELMTLDEKKLGSKFMGKFCTNLLDTHTLLLSLGEEDWLTSNRTVSELENKLPRDEKLKWAEMCGQCQGQTKFEKF